MGESHTHESLPAWHLYCKTQGKNEGHHRQKESNQNASAQHRRLRRKNPLSRKQRKKRDSGQHKDRCPSKKNKSLGVEKDRNCRQMSEKKAHPKEVWAKP